MYLDDGYEWSQKESLGNRKKWSASCLAFGVWEKWLDNISSS